MQWGIRKEDPKMEMLTTNDTIAEMTNKEVVDALRSLRSFLINEEFFSNRDIMALEIAINKLEKEEKEN